MNPLKNHIFYSICERSFEYFKGTKYSSFRNFSALIKNEMYTWQRRDTQSVLVYKLDKDTKILIAYVASYLKKIYNLDTSEAMDYIIEYFLGQHYERFEESVRIVATHFPLSLN